MGFEHLWEGVDRRCEHSNSTYFDAFSAVLGKSDNSSHFLCNIVHPACLPFIPSTSNFHKIALTYDFFQIQPTNSIDSPFGNKVHRIRPNYGYTARLWRVV